MRTLPRRLGAVSMILFIGTFLTATFAVSQLTPQIPRFLQGYMSLEDLLVSTVYLVVLLASIFLLGRIIYASELASGRVKRRVRILE